MTHNLLPGLTAFALGEPIRPLGHRKDGRPIFPIAGGAPPDPPAPTDPPADPPPADPPPADPPKFEAITTQEEFNRRLGDRLAREKAKYADYDDLKAKAAAHDKTLQDAMSESEKAAAKAREEGKTEALTTVNSRLVAAEARALAAELKFRNPTVAVPLLDLKDIKVDDNGDPDKAAIKAKLEELAKDEPYLVDDGKKTPPKPDRSQGGGGGDDTPSVSRGREMFEARRGGKKTPA